MSERKIVQQYLQDNKLVSEYSDGSVEYTIPEAGKQYQKKGFKDELRKAEGRLSGYSGPQKEVGGYNAQTNFPENINKMLDENEHLKRELEQYRRDKASILAQPDGGGKVRLPNESSKRFVYSGSDPYRQGIDDLYSRQKSGDLDAKRMLDRLWETEGVKSGILQLQKEGISMVACINCSGMLLNGERKCKSCGFDYTKRDREAFEV